VKFDARCGEMRALAVANARFWPTVAPVMWHELARWRREASAIADPNLRGLALEKLDDEAFNAEVAATLATLAPATRRGPTVKAIVALEVLFDYLDGRTEQASDDPRADGERAFAPFIAAVSGRASQRREAERGSEAEYVWALSDCVAECAGGLPAFAAVRELATGAAERCARAQTRLHAAATLGDRQLRRWAEGASIGSGLEWQEYAGGCASSVLAAHALIAAAAQESISRQQAAAIDRAYLAIGALVTTLDSLIDEPQDAARGEPGFLRLFDDREHMRTRVTALTRLALARARDAPNGAHHAMTLAGVAAYYTSHPGSRSQRARPVAAAVRRELAPTIWPTLAVMRVWRMGKLARDRAQCARHAPLRRTVRI
jgi:tetraprenyl-beta-curcumene synthase